MNLYGIIAINVLGKLLTVVSSVLLQNITIKRKTTVPPLTHRTDLSLYRQDDFSIFNYTMEDIKEMMEVYSSYVTIDLAFEIFKNIVVFFTTLFVEVQEKNLLT